MSIPGQPTEKKNLAVCHFAVMIHNNIAEWRGTSLCRLVGESEIRNLHRWSQQCTLTVGEFCTGDIKYDQIQREKDYKRK